MSTNNDDELKYIDSYSKYKDLLQSVILIPFRKLNFLSKNHVFPVLIDQIKLKVDRNEETTTKYKIDLSYGLHRWSVTENVINIFSLNTYLYYKGVHDLTEGRLNLITEERYDYVEQFLRSVLKKTSYLDIGKVYNFLRISKYSFYGEKGFEEKFYVCISKTELNRLCCANECFKFSNNFNKMIIICKKTNLIFVDYKNQYKEKFVLFFTGKLNIKLKKHTFYSELVITSDNDIITIESFKHNYIDDLYNNIIKNEEEIKKASNFYSFSPVRKNNIVNFYIDGKEYFDNLYDTMKLARKEVFIAGWWIHPKLFLKRRIKNDFLDKKYRFDRFLKSRAEDGVKIYILIYKEFQMALNINSSYTCNILSKLHKNIQIIGHPELTPNGPIYWSHHEKIVVIDQKIAYVGGIDITLGRYDTKSHSLFEKKAPKHEIQSGHMYKQNTINEKKLDHVLNSGIDKNLDQYIWPGMDFSNPLRKDFVNIENFDTSLIDRHKTPRMPWHDIQCKIVGSSAYDVSRHFIERWNFIVSSYNYNFSPNLIIPNEECISNISSLLNYYEFSSNTDEFSTKLSIESEKKFEITTQILRSVGMWSAGRKVENSVENAYKELIISSENFVYIENQFFITKCNENIFDCPQNTIGLTLVERIIRAERNNENFKVYIIIPLLPAFEANISPNGGSSIKEIIRVQLESIRNGEKSLMGALVKNGIDPKKYIVFMSLRKVYYDGVKLNQEQIYVHSKIIIADGKVAIIGSANLNDRSMLGSRDSEICIRIEETNPDLIQRLLKSLLVEHLGIGKSNNNNSWEKNIKLDEFFDDERWFNLESDEIFSAIIFRAKSNTQIFRELFRSLPDDEITTSEDYEIFKSKKPLCLMEIKNEVIKSIISRIKGNIVLFPNNFLCNENFERGVLTMHGLLPKIIYY